MFNFDDPIFIKILEVGDVFEITNGTGVYAMMATEADVSKQGKKVLEEMYHSTVIPGKIKIRVGRLIELEDFVFMGDDELVFTQFDKRYGDRATDARLEAPNIYPSTTVYQARALKEGSPERAFYKFI